MRKKHGRTGCADVVGRKQLGGRSSRSWCRPMACPHPGSSTPSDLAMQGSTVMRQSGAATLATEEQDACMAHVRVCGGAGWVTTGSTRKLTAYSLRSAPAFGSS